VDEPSTAPGSPDVVSPVRGQRSGKPDERRSRDNEQDACPADRRWTGTGVTRGVCARPVGYRTKTGFCWRELWTCLPAGAIDPVVGGNCGPANSPGHRRGQDEQHQERSPLAIPVPDRSRDPRFMNLQEPGRSAADAFAEALEWGGPFPFAAFRKLRFPDGPACPRCGNGRVHRWGRFSGRRRFRCVSCGRTFSDFTGTCLAYVKRIDDWPRFCLCVAAELSIRGSARVLAADPTTTFRWRHRLLRALHESDDVVLTGEIVVGEMQFAYSEKGKGNPKRAAQRVAGARRCRTRTVWAVVAREGAGGNTYTEVGGFARVRPRDLTAVLISRTRGATCLVSGTGRLGAVARTARDLGLRHRRTTGRSLELMGLRAYTTHLRRWLARFRGVATRYLDHYLAWHRTTHSRASPDVFALLVSASAFVPG